MGSSTGCQGSAVEHTVGGNSASSCEGRYSARDRSPHGGGRSTLMSHLHHQDLSPFSEPLGSKIKSIDSDFFENPCLVALQNIFQNSASLRYFPLNPHQGSHSSHQLCIFFIFYLLQLPSLTTTSATVPHTSVLQPTRTCPHRHTPCRLGLC